MSWYVKVLKQYVDFSGRARRREYWMFVLVNVVIVIVLSLIDTLLGTGGFRATSGGGSFYAANSLGLLSGLYTLAVLLPSIAVTVRRLHDTDRTGWWILLGFIPIIGGIVLLVFYVLEGTRGPNRYGPDPKATTRRPPTDAREQQEPDRHREPGGQRHEGTRTEERELRPRHRREQQAEPADRHPDEHARGREHTEAAAGAGQLPRGEQHPERERHERGQHDGQLLLEGEHAEHEQQPADRGDGHRGDPQRAQPARARTRGPPGPSGRCPPRR